jgi:tRNA pseudouridine32 synthase/23S rRNA pseudouridine746 synthase
MIAEHHLTVTEDAQDNALNFLAIATKFSKQQLKAAMQKGAVWIERNQQIQRLRRGKKQLQAGDQLHLYYNEDVLNEQPPQAKLIADEGDFSIWYKPYGMYCQGSKWGDHCTINRWIEQQLDRPSFIVHRLDRAATGLIIIAHKKNSLAIFNQLFQHRTITKKYQAIVQGKFSASEKPITIDRDIDDKKSISHVQLITYNEGENRSLLEVKIDTGRKHQIRRHLSEYGYPIIGDRLYGKDNPENINLQLCSYQLNFNYPEKGDLAYLLDYKLRPNI